MNLVSECNQKESECSRLHYVKLHLFVAVERIVLVVETLQCVQIANVQGVDLLLGRMIALFKLNRPTHHGIDRRSERQQTKVLREQSSAFEDHERNVEPGGQSLLNSGEQMVFRILFDVVHVVLTKNDHRHQWSARTEQKKMSFRSIFGHC